MKRLMMRHNLIHQDKPSWHCLLCHQIFYYLDVAVAHLATHHGVDNFNICFSSGIIKEAKSKADPLA
jgi:uncharacterized Zn-finger protein